jgi:hypothetical protein
LAVSIAVIGNLVAKLFTVADADDVLSGSDVVRRSPFAFELAHDGKHFREDAGLVTWVKRPHMAEIVTACFCSAKSIRQKVVGQSEIGFSETLRGMR